MDCRAISGKYFVCLFLRKICKRFRPTPSQKTFKYKTKESLLFQSLIWSELFKAGELQQCNKQPDIPSEPDKTY